MSKSIESVSPSIVSNSAFVESMFPSESTSKAIERDVPSISSTSALIVFKSESSASIFKSIVSSSKLEMSFSTFTTI